MAQIKRSLILFCSLFLFAVICGSVLHNLFTGERLQDLVVRNLSQELPGVNWTVHGAQVKLADGLLPIIALEISEIEGTRTEECGKNLSLKAKEVLLPVDIWTLIKGPVRLGRIRFRELIATEIPGIVQKCERSDKEAWLMPHAGELSLRDGKVLARDNNFEVEGVFTLSAEALAGETVPPFHIQGHISKENYAIQINWRESKIQAELSPADRIIDFKASKVPVVEVLKILRGMGVRPLPLGVGPNWLEFSGSYNHEGGKELKLQEVLVSGDIGEIRSNEVVLNLSDKPKVSPFELQLTKVRVAEAAKIFRFESFPYFFRKQGEVTGLVRYQSSSPTFKGFIENVEIEISRQGRKGHVLLSKALVDMSFVNKIFEAKMNQFEVSKGKAEGSIEVRFAENDSKAKVDFSLIQIDPEMLENVLKVVIGSSVLRGEVEVKNSKITSLALNGRLEQLSGKGFKTQVLKTDLNYKTAQASYLNFQTDRMDIVSAELDNSVSNLFKEIQKHVSEAGSWQQIKGQLSTEEGVPVLAQVQFEYPDKSNLKKMITITPDLKSKNTLVIQDFRSKSFRTS